MSIAENITATINYTVGQELDNYGQVDSLDVVLLTLRKHGIHPIYFEHEEERDAPKADAALTYESKLPEIASEFEDGYWKVTETTTDDDGTTTTQTVTDEKP